MISIRPMSKHVPLIEDPLVEYTATQDLGVTYGIPQVNLVRAVQELAPDMIQHIDKQLEEMDVRRKALLTERTQLQRLLEALHG